ncbi:MAG TPA: galactokinase [Elusimicrobia bacterium]|nr:galactokinase [Elusimicrobiota bacterium]HBT60571.1 galactokinase [Elusimicrobiota bacterium]
MSREPRSRAEAAARKFRAAFGGEPLLVRSPGRINLIGEHTDYNEGFVLPAAIEQAIFVAAARRCDARCRFIAADLSEEYAGDVHPAKKPQRHWSDYINGVVDQLQKAGHSLSGFDCVFGGDIPIGAGMSSSAALECAVVFALDRLFGLGLDRLAMVKIAQRAENEFVGVKCGIMDQFASMLGRAGHVIRLDCRSLDYAYVPFDTSAIRVVLFDTGVKHSLASSEYNARRAQCEAGVRLLAESVPSIRSLRDASLEQLRRHVLPKDELVYRRCAYVVEENARLRDACADLVAGDIASFGRRMFAAHEGLSRSYEVSCDELDFLVDRARQDGAVLGARMMGGGFGGCTINLVKAEAVEAVAARVAREYESRFKTAMKTYVTRISEGTSEIQGLCHA